MSSSEARVIVTREGSKCCGSLIGHFICELVDPIMLHLCDQVGKARERPEIVGRQSIVKAAMGPGAGG